MRQQALGWNTIAGPPGIVRVAHESVDTDLGIVRSVSLGRALAGRGEEGGMKPFRPKGSPDTPPNGDVVLIPDETANEQVLEDFRGASPTSPGQNPAQGRDPARGKGNPSSEC